MASKILLENTYNVDSILPNETKNLLSKYFEIIDNSNVSAEKKVILKTLLKNQAAINENLKKIPFRESVVSSAAIAPLETYIFPVLIRAMVRTFADQLVSVQPVQSTLAQVRILKTKYGTGKGKISEGDYGLMTFGSKGVKFSPYYTSPYVDGEEVKLIWPGNPTEYNLKFPAIGKINYTGRIKVSFGEKQQEAFVSGSIGLGDPEIKLVDFEGALIYMRFAPENKLVFKLEGEFTAEVDLTLTYTTNLEANRSPSLDISLEKLEISVEVRRLFSAATIEAILELSAHQIQWNELLGEVLAAELAVEIDRSIIQDIISKTIAEGYVSTFRAELPATWDRPVGDYIKNLYYAIQQANALIYERTRRIPGNWIVCSAPVAAALEAANYIVMSENYLDEYSGMGFFPLGVLRGLRNKIFVDVSKSFPKNMILVGAKGNSPYDAGYVYAPYAPAIPILSNIMDIEVPGGTLYIGLYQAAGFRMIDNGFYHIIKIEGDLSNLYQTYYSPEV